MVPDKLVQMSPRSAQTPRAQLIFTLIFTHFVPRHCQLPHTSIRLGKNWWHTVTQSSQLPLSDTSPSPDSPLKPTGVFPSPIPHVPCTVRPAPAQREAHWTSASPYTTDKRDEVGQRLWYQWPSIANHPGKASCLKESPEPLHTGAPPLRSVKAPARSCPLALPALAPRWPFSRKNWLCWGGDDMLKSHSSIPREG